jgi:alanyl-tRNA synthetase
VRVVSFGDASVELCGGTHINDTAKIGTFCIVKESGVSAGVRRIEAICSLAAINYMNDFKEAYDALAAELKSNQPILAVAKLKNEIKELKAKLAEAAKGVKQEFDVLDINGTKLIVATTTTDAKTQIDELKNKFESVAIMLFSEAEDRINVSVGTKGCDVDAGVWLRGALSTFGAKGGGRKDFASGSMAQCDITSAINSAIELAKKGFR